MRGTHREGTRGRWPAANTGTLHSKTLRESAPYLSGFQQRGLHGINVELDEQVTARDFLYRDRVTGNLNRHLVDVYSGTAEFLDPSTVEVTGAEGATTRLTADVFLIATGSIPYRPPNLHSTIRACMIRTPFCRWLNCPSRCSWRVAA